MFIPNENNNNMLLLLYNMYLFLNYEFLLALILSYRFTEWTRTGNIIPIHSPVRTLSGYLLFVLNQLLIGK